MGLQLYILQLSPGDNCSTKSLAIGSETAPISVLKGLTLSPLLQSRRSCSSSRSKASSFPVAMKSRIRRLFPAEAVGVLLALVCSAAAAAAAAAVDTVAPPSSTSQRTRLTQFHGKCSATKIQSIEILLSVKHSYTYSNPDWENILSMRSERNGVAGVVERTGRH